jgi:hypothetical protein
MPKRAGSVLFEELISACDAANKEELSHTDLIFALNAINKLSEEKDLAAFGDNLLKIAIERIGAAKGLFLLNNDTNKFVVQSVEATCKTATNTEFADSVVRCASQNKKIIILGDAPSNSFFSNDSHIKRHTVKSILCIPLVHKGKTRAIMYLEDFNNEKKVTQCHFLLLKVIISQASLLLCHIQRYQDLIESEEHCHQLSDKNLTKVQTLSKRTFSETTTHDIRSSINFIIGYAQVLKSSLNGGGPAKNKDEMADLSDHIISSGWNLLYLINRVIKTAHSVNCLGDNRHKDKILTP